MLWEMFTIFADTILAMSVMVVPIVVLTFIINWFEGE